MSSAQVSVSKAKEKKLKRKEALASLKLNQELIRSANSVDDYLSNLKPFGRFNRNGLSAVITSHRSSELPKETLDWALELTRSNMQRLYEGSRWGWSDKDKLEELADEDARLLLVRTAPAEDAGTSSGELIAFVHFRFIMEETAGDSEIPVVYCYEIQLSEGAQRKGLGKFLMQLLELIGIQNGMDKSMLTVFKANKAAVDFYRNALKYGLDEISSDEADYHILSKPLPKSKKATA